MKYLMKRIVSQNKNCFSVEAVSLDQSAERKDSSDCFSDEAVGLDHGLKGKIPVTAEEGFYPQ